MVPIPFIVLALNIMTVASAGNTARGSGLAAGTSAKSSLLKNNPNTRSRIFPPAETLQLRGYDTNMLQYRMEAGICWGEVHHIIRGVTALYKSRYFLLKCDDLILAVDNI